jgi:hypothetical protein
MGDLTGGGGSILAGAIEANFTQDHVPAQNGLLSDGASLGSNVEVELCSQQGAGETVNRVTRILPCCGETLQKSETFFARRYRVIAKLDTWINDQIVEQDPTGLPASVGGCLCSPVLRRAGVPQCPIGCWARVARASRNPGRVRQVGKGIVLYGGSSVL